MGTGAGNQVLLVPSPVLATYSTTIAALRPSAWLFTKLTTKTANEY